MNGYAVFQTKEGAVPQQSGFLDMDGTVTMSPQWEQIRPFSTTGFTSVYDNKLNKYVIVKREGKIVRDSQSYRESA